MPRGGPPPKKKGNSTLPTLADYASPYASIADPNLQKSGANDDDDYFEPHKYTNDGNLIPSPPLTPPPRERRSSSTTSIKTHCSGDSVSSTDTTYTVISAHLHNDVFTYQSRGGAPPKPKKEIPPVPPLPSTLPTAPLLPRTPIVPPSASPSNSPVLSAHSVSPPMSPTPTNSRSTPTRSGRLPALTDLTIDGSAAPNGNKYARSEGSPVRPRMPPTSMSEPDMYSPNARRAASAPPIHTEDWQRMCLYASDYDF
ncbi:hypothetical protein BC936DRAFT_148448 [Jimgerdemannia flammicorona]|uniref:Uncharacterized protein n=1 Tax=Jimgerdemannia flammicorona TaxID=994334 RepID=A0A433D318_9FUNG|nr:hypothetical protein BC936DRAFT_148448 [Jimgerdemannia flammicorona]